MQKDRFGLEISTASGAARDAYAEGCDAVLSAGAGGEAAFARALEADPAFALARAGLARAQFVLARVPMARASAIAARQMVAGASERERSHVDALCLGIEGKPVDALAATRAHLARWPKDAMVLAPATGVFGLIGFSGRQEREPEQLALLDELEPALGGDWWFDSVRAFALEECGRIEDARRLIERSMAVNPRNAHGAHIMAHVLYEAGEDAAALEYLDGWLPAYEREGLMHCHISWHVAMCALALGKLDRAWDVYRAQVHPGGQQDDPSKAGSWGPPINAVTDGVAFLWRAELAGEPRRAKLWNEMREYAEENFASPGIAFVDVHASVALAATGGDVAELSAALAQREAAGKAPAGSVVRRLGDAFAAYARGDWADAIRRFEDELPETVRIGGSRAQRDLAAYTLLAAYLKDGRADAARAFIARREHRRPAVAVAGFAA